MPIGLVRGYTRHLTPVSPAAARTDPLDRGLVGEWRFDPVTGLSLPDYSGYGNDGSWVIGVPIWVTTEFGLALRFSGGVNEYIDIDPVCSDINVSEGTVSVFNVRPFADDAKLVYLWEARRDAENRIQLFYSTIGAGAPRFIYEANNVALSLAGTNADAPQNQFCDWTGTWSVAADEVNFYINGVLVAGPVNGLGAWVGGAPLNSAIGAGHTGFAPWDGDIALVRIYNRALSAAEVRLRYEMCLKRAQPMTHVWMMPWGFVAAAPPAAAALPIFSPPDAIHTLVFGGVTVR